MADLEALPSEHRDFLRRHAAEHDGGIIKARATAIGWNFPA
jgi:hypothetical protein